MSGGKLAAQVAHAAVTCALESKAKKAKWFSNGTGRASGRSFLKAQDIEQLRHH